MNVVTMCPLSRTICADLSETIHVTINSLAHNSVCVHDCLEAMGNSYDSYIRSKLSAKGALYDSISLIV